MPWLVQDSENTDAQATFEKFLLLCCSVTLGLRPPNPTNPICSTHEEIQREREMERSGMRELLTFYSAAEDKFSMITQHTCESYDPDESYYSWVSSAGGVGGGGTLICLEIA